MDDTLKTLIAYYEEEKKRLSQIINDYTKEWEYEFAHFHSQAIFQVNGKLQTLYNLQDRRHEEKIMKQNGVRYLEERIEAETSDYMQEGLKKMLEQKKQELEKLNQVSEPVNNDDAAFNETLNNLLERRIEGFTLFLSQENRFQFNFTYQGNVLKVVLPYVKRHLKREILSDENILVLRDMGFTFNRNMSRLLLLLTGDKTIIAQEVKWHLAKIVFELLYFPSFEGKSCIGVKEKARR